MRHVRELGKQSTRGAVVLLALVAVVVPACTTDADGCVPTSVQAVDATRLDLTDASSSATLQATLTESEAGAPVGGKTLRFSVLDDGSEVHSIDGSTGGDGSAAVDLKRLDVSALQAIVRGDSFRASFAGDSTHCSSQAGASLSVANAPAGVNIPTP